MKFGRVVGTVVATRKYEGLEGVKFLVVQLLDEALKPQGEPQMPEVFVPVDLAITGIVDEVDVEQGPRRHQPTAVWHVALEEDD
jgi:microcompartment protein CcmK/EutM